MPVACPAPIRAPHPRASPGVCVQWRSVNQAPFPPLLGWPWPPHVLGTCCGSLRLACPTLAVETGTRLLPSARCECPGPKNSDNAGCAPRGIAGCRLTF